MGSQPPCEVNFTVTPIFQKRKLRHRELRLLFQSYPARKSGFGPGQSDSQFLCHATFHFTIFFSQNLFPKSVPTSSVIALPALVLGLRACLSHILTTNEVFANLRLGPQRPLKQALWEEPVSFLSELSGVADGTRAFESNAGQTGEQELFGTPGSGLQGSWPGTGLPSASLFCSNPSSPSGPGLFARMQLGQA